MHCNTISEKAPVAIIFFFNYQHGLKVDGNLLIAHPPVIVPPVAILSEAKSSDFCENFDNLKKKKSDYL